MEQSRSLQRPWGSSSLPPCQKPSEDLWLFPASLARPAQREQKDRDKAWRAAGKQAKPLWEEDGRRRGLLDKYDEEEEEMMQVSQ